MNHMKIQRNSFHSLEQVQNEYLNQNLRTPAVRQEGSLSFQDILEQASGAEKEVRFSKHASNRLNTRNIERADGETERGDEESPGERHKRFAGVSRFVSFYCQRTEQHCGDCHGTE